MGATMRRAVVVILGVAVLALLVARYAREIIDFALRLPRILLDLAAGLLRGAQALFQQLAMDAGPVLAPIGDALSDTAADPGGRLGSLVAGLRDLLAGLLTGARDLAIDWWAWSVAHPETIIVVLFWAFVGIAVVAYLRRRARPASRRRRPRDL